MKYNFKLATIIADDIDKDMNYFDNRRSLIVAIIIITLMPQVAHADSSWIWLTDNRPFDILPPVAIATIVIEVLAIWLIPHTGRFIKTTAAVLFANAASFLLPYGLYWWNNCYPSYDNMLNSDSYYIVGAGFLILTLALEIPVVYNLLKKHVSSEKKLLWTIIGSNIVTTAMVAVIERMVTDGYYV